MTMTASTCLPITLERALDTIGVRRAFSLPVRLSGKSPVSVQKTELDANGQPEF